MFHWIFDIFGVLISGQKNIKMLPTFVPQSKTSIFLHFVLLNHRIMKNCIFLTESCTKCCWLSALMINHHIIVQFFSICKSCFWLEFLWIHQMIYKEMGILQENMFIIAISYLNHLPCKLIRRISIQRTHLILYTNAKK